VRAKGGSAGREERGILALERAGHELRHPVPDVGRDERRRFGGATECGEGRVHRRREVEARVDERTVEIEEEGVDRNHAARLAGPAAAVNARSRDARDSLPRRDGPGTVGRS